MSAEQLGSLDVAERRDVSLEEHEELSELSQVVNGSSTTDIDGDVAQGLVTDFLETFATPPQMEAFEKATEGSIVSRTKEATMWPRFQAGIMWHPAIIGKLATLSGLKSLDSIDKATWTPWKDEAACKEDTRFVSPGDHRPIKETRELMDICEGCPVLADCHEHVINSSLQYGFWAGVARSKGVGYHDNGAPVTLEEQRAKIDRKATRA
jgi:hypothetical protein